MRIDLVTYSAQSFCTSQPYRRIHGFRIHDEMSCYLIQCAPPMGGLLGTEGHSWRQASPSLDRAAGSSDQGALALSLMAGFEASGLDGATRDSDGGHGAAIWDGGADAVQDGQVTSDRTAVGSGGGVGGGAADGDQQEEARRWRAGAGSTGQ